MRKNLPLILVSQSKRRKELLKEAGISFKVVSSNVHEKIPSVSSNPSALAIRLAKQKVKSIAGKFPNHILLGADTLVTLGREILGKPKNERDAFRMLKKLSGKSNEVITGVYLLHPSRKKSVQFYERTKVFFAKIPDDAIRYYVKKYKPFDKSGSYGIQEWIGLCYLEKIEGDFYNVMGLPVFRVMDALKKF